jgi:hypothetical protein
MFYLLEDKYMFHDFHDFHDFLTNPARVVEGDVASLSFIAFKKILHTARKDCLSYYDFSINYLDSCLLQLKNTFEILNFKFLFYKYLNFFFDFKLIKSAAELKFFVLTAMGEDFLKNFIQEEIEYRYKRAMAYGCMRAEHIHLTFDPIFDYPLSFLVKWVDSCNPNLIRESLAVNREVVFIFLKISITDLLENGFPVFKFLFKLLFNILRRL